MQPLPPTRIRRESDVLRSLDAAFRERLPEGWEMSLAPGSASAGTSPTPCSPSRRRMGPGVVAVEAKMRVDGRDLQRVLDQARMLTVDLPADGPERGPPIVAARFLSRRVRDELVRAWRQLCRHHRQHPHRAGAAQLVHLGLRCRARPSAGASRAAVTYRCCRGTGRASAVQTPTRQSRFASSPSAAGHRRGPSVACSNCSSAKPSSSR